MRVEGSCPGKHPPCQAHAGKVHQRGVNRSRPPARIMSAIWRMTLPFCNRLYRYATTRQSRSSAHPTAGILVMRRHLTICQFKLLRFSSFQRFMICVQAISIAVSWSLQRKEEEVNRVAPKVLAVDQRLLPFCFCFCSFSETVCQKPETTKKETKPEARKYGAAQRVLQISPSSHMLLCFT